MFRSYFLLGENAVSRRYFGDLYEISEGLAVVWRRKGCTEREIAALRNRAARPMHYEAEKARRREVAEERRRVRRRVMVRLRR